MSCYDVVTFTCAVIKLECCLRIVVLIFVGTTANDEPAITAL